MPIAPQEDELLEKARELELEISARKKAEEKIEILEMQLRQAQKMETIGMLAGGIAHDFNNILASIIGYTELSIEDIPRNSMVGKNLQQILIAGKRARDLVKQILSFSRQSEWKKMPVKLNSIVKEVSLMLRSMLPSSIEIRTDPGPETLTVVAEPSQMYQVMINLCTNAAQAMGGGKGLLEIRLAKKVCDKTPPEKHPDLEPGEYALIEVRDNGPGISPDIVGRIFEPYFTTKEKNKGTGLGLAVVKGIVMSGGGRVWADSKPGEGASLSILLPLVRIDEVHRDSDAARVPPCGFGRLLFVDDEPIIANMQKHILERLGYTVTVESSSLKALKKFRDEPQRFDAVITDMTMPEMTGDQLAKAVKEIRPDIPIILCTGFSEMISPDEAFRLGIDEFLMKPVEKITIADSLKKVLDPGGNAIPKIGARV